MSASPSGPWCLRVRPWRISVVLALLAAPALPAARERLDLRYAPLLLPGAPAAVVAADLDGDGRRDLVVVATGVHWREIGTTEQVTMDDVEGLVEVLTVVPSLVEERELRVFPGRSGGGFGPGSLRLALDPSVLTLAAGPPGAPIVALTDTGASALRLRRRDDAAAGADAFAGGELAWEALVADPPVLAGSGTFLPDLPIVVDVDGDGAGDLLIPTVEGLAIHLATATGFAPESASRIRFPAEAFGDDEGGDSGDGLVRRHPLAELRDVDGDRRPDLLLYPVGGGLRGLLVLRNLGGGRFAEPLAPLGPAPTRSAPAAEPAATASSAPRPEPAWFGDLDGDSRAEVVTVSEEPEPEDAGMRESLARARNPRMHYAFHRTGDDLAPVAKAYRELDVTGYGVGDLDDADDIRLPGGFVELSGDGRADLVTISLDFSLAQIVKIMAVRRIGIGLDFHLWCQAPDGSFRAVPGLDLSGRFNLDLDDFAVRQLSQFAGDFDGDGRPEFVQIGRGRTVTIHRGNATCAYPARPDLALELEEAPRDLALVQVRDLDGDGLADLMVTQPQGRSAGRGDDGSTAPVRLDLYLSAGAR